MTACGSMVGISDWVSGQPGAAVDWEADSLH